MLFYPVGVDLSTPTPRFLTDRLHARRRERGTRWRRLPADRQALLVLAHLRRGHTYAPLAAGFGIGVSTVYRYVVEAVDPLAALAVDLPTALRTAASKAFVILDGTLLPIDRVGSRPAVLLRQAQAPRDDRAGPHRPRRPPAVGLTSTSRRCGERLSAGQQAVNHAHAKIRALGEQAMTTLKTWRLLRKPRCSTTRITSLVQDILTLHLKTTHRG